MRVIPTAGRPGLNTRTCRTLWVRLHRWVGLSAGLAFAVMGLTGSLLAFRDDLDVLLAPQFHRTHGTGARRSLEDLIATARTHHPAMTEITVHMARPPGPVRLVYRDPTRGESLRFEMAINPYSGDVQGERLRSGGISFTRAEILGTMFHLHANLWIGKPGRTIAGVFALLLLFSALSGIYLWWPRGRTWRQAFSIQRGAGRVRLHFDLHRIAGIAASLVLAVIAFTGGYFSFRPVYQAVIDRFSKTTLFDPAPQSTRQVGQPPIPLADVLAIARVSHPQAGVRSVTLPRSLADSYTVSLRASDDISDHGNVRLFIDQWSGEVLRVRDRKRANAGDTLLLWMFPLHTGQAFGITGRIVVFITGAALPLLLVTGFVLWRGKRQALRGRSAPLEAHRARQQADRTGACPYLPLRESTQTQPATGPRSRCSQQLR
ncbi:MAG: PepSY-associated TM helix domain-containing protein [Gammaproteobacteria bacterium]